MKLLRSLAVVSSAAAAAVVLVVAPAQAGQTVTWQTNHYDHRDGYVKAKVNVNFVSKRAVDIEGAVEDMCPKDGRAATSR